MLSRSTKSSRFTEPAVFRVYPGWTNHCHITSHISKIHINHTSIYVEVSKVLISFTFPHKNCARNPLPHLPCPCNPLISSMTLAATFGKRHKSASCSIRSSLQPPVQTQPTDPSGTASMLSRGGPLDIKTKPNATCSKRTLLKARTCGRQQQEIYGNKLVFTCTFRPTRLCRSVYLIVISFYYLYCSHHQAGIPTDSFTFN